MSGINSNTVCVCVYVCGQSHLKHTEPPLYWASEGDTPNQTEQLWFGNKEIRLLLWAQCIINAQQGHLLVLGWLDHAKGHPIVSIPFAASMSALLTADLTVALPSGNPQKPEYGLSGPDSLEQFSFLQIFPLKPSELFLSLKVTLRDWRNWILLISDF